MRVRLPPLAQMIAKIVSKAIKNKIFPGCVVGVVWKNGKRLVFPFGNFTYDKNSPIIKKDSIFDVASITKSIPTSSLALKLIDQKKLNFNDKVVKFIPELDNLKKDQILIKHLLTQTLDLEFNGKPLSLSEHKNKTPDEILNIIFNAKLKYEPGTTYNYNNTTSILLGLVIERIENSTLDKLAEKYFFKPMKMNRTTFKPLEKFDKNEIVPTEIDLWRKMVIQGKVHDESAYVLGERITPGSAGLFSTTPDLLIFLEMLLNKGVLNRKGYFSEEIIEQICANQLISKSRQTGLGWELNQPQYMGSFCSKNTIGKTGFTGCVVICDIKKGIGFTLLSNYTYPKRKENSLLINKLRTDLANIIFNINLTN